MYHLIFTGQMDIHDVKGGGFPALRKGVVKKYMYDFLRRFISRRIFLRSCGIQRIYQYGQFPGIRVLTQGVLLLQQRNAAFQSIRCADNFRNVGTFVD